MSACLVRFGNSCVMIMVLGACAASGAASFRVTGSIGAEAYGYQDAAGEDHLWVHQRTRVSATQVDGPLSFRFSGGYLGDNADDFGDSGRLRFLEGNLAYGGELSRLNARVGRFFLYRGGAVGVLDGVEASYAPWQRWNVSAFAGLMGPLNREFELADSDQSLSFGGTIRWTPGPGTLLGTRSVSASFVRQRRDSTTVRELVGLSTTHRIRSNWTWLNTLHARTEGALVRKVVTRVRHATPTLNMSAEAALLGPDVADLASTSIFKESEGVARLRIGLDRYVTPGRWAGGIEAAMLLAGGTSGFRGGPVLTTPWGQAGYRVSAGDRAKSSGPWASLRARPLDGVEVYAYGAIVSYQWDRFDVENDELMMGHAGVRYRPACQRHVVLYGEVQGYQTPQFDFDRRFKGGITWQFDSRGGGS